MKGLSLRVSLRSAWKLAERLEGGLLILLLCSPLCGIAKADDNASSGEASLKSETPASGPSDSTPLAQRMKLEMQAADLSAQATKFVGDGELEEAVAAQRERVSVVKTLYGASDWRTKNEQVRLSDLEHASRLTEEQQKTFVAAHHALEDGKQKMDLEEYDDAETLLGKALDGFTTVLGENCIAVAFTSEKLGINSATVGNPKANPSKAKEYFLRAASVWKTIAGENHPGYAHECTLASDMCIETKDFNQAEALLRDVLDRQRRMFGAKSLEYSHVLANLSRVMIEKKSLLEAEALCLQAISVLEQTQNQDSQAMAFCLLNLADVNIACEEYSIAEKNLCRALTLYQRVLPPRNPVTARTLDRYAWLLRKMDRIDEALAMESKAEAMRYEFGATAR